MSRVVVAGFWWLGGMRDWRLLFLVAAMSWRAAGQVKDRAEPGRRGGAGGVLEVTGRAPDDLAAGNGSRGRCAGIRLSSVPSPGLPVRQCRWLQSSLRVPRPGAGLHGAVRVRGGGQAGSIKTTPAPPCDGRRGRQIGDLAPGRWPGKAVHAASPAVAGGPAWDFCRQRICPSRRP